MRHADGRQWDKEWYEWATTDGDEAKALHDIIEKCLGRTPDETGRLTGSGPRREIRDRKDGDAAPAGDGDAVQEKTPIGRLAMAILLAAALAVGAGVAGSSMWHSHQLRDAEDSCTQAADGYRRSLARESTALAHWKKLGQDPRDDAKILMKGSRAAKKNAKPDTAPTTCPAGDRTKLEAAAAKMRGAADKNGEAAEDLEGTTGAIRKQRSARTLAAARNGLVSKEAQASSLYESSAGNVADDGTRARLKEQIGKARHLMKGSPSTKSIRIQSKNLDTAMDAVNGSIQAKSQSAPAPEPAAEPEQPAAPSAPAPSIPTPNLAPGWNSRPVPAAPSAPPATPSRPQSGSDGWYVPPAPGGDGMPDHL